MGVLINVGSSSRNPNGRGRIFNDLTFEYLPIPEALETKESVPTYRDLGFTNVAFPDLPVHLDPEFNTYTYGHTKRGFGDIKSLIQLKKEDVLFFYATLQKGDDWSPYIIGYFKNIEVFDCRKLPEKQILGFKSKGFLNNAHLKRVNSSVALLIKGGTGSKLLKKAIPLAEDHSHLALSSSLINFISTANGRKIKPEAPWFRWTLICSNADELLRMVEI